MTQTQIQQTQTLLQEAKDIVIIPHKNPDGDAMGSTLALYHYLIKKGHRPVVIAPNNYPQFLQWLPGNNQVLIYETSTKAANQKIQEAQLIFTLDFNDLSRVGLMENVLQEVAAPFVMIDHHQQPSEYAQVTYSDPKMSSTCEMVYHFIEALGDKSLIDIDMGACLYTGIMTDTGSFRFSSTTPTTHRVIANIMELGVPAVKIHQNIYDNNRVAKFQLLGRALNNLIVLPEFKAAYITLTQKELEQYDFQKGDTEGFVNYALSISGVELAAIFIENKQEKIIKISFRSKSSFSVNEFARAHFSGGGHTNAAGGRSLTSLENTVKEFINLLSSYSELAP